jgi:DnaK suppressor protein
MAKKAKKPVKKTVKKSAPKKKAVVRRKKAPKPQIHKFILKTAIHSKIRDVDEKSLSASDVHKYREILTHKRDDLLAVVQRKKEQELQTSEEELGDEADIATRSVEREMLFELTDSEKQTLDMVEASLRKMEKGVFGLCESCQKPIGRQRIDVMPWARYCIRCQSLQEVPAGE